MKLPLRKPRAVALVLSTLTLVAGLLFTSNLSATNRPGARSPVPDVGGNRDVAVLSYNAYVGTLIEQILALDPTDPAYQEQLVATVTALYHGLAASDPPARMAAIADQIAARKPDFVGLEELSQVLRQSPGDLVAGGTTPAQDVVYDYLQLVLDALDARGVHYAAAVVANELDVELPMLNLDAEGNIVGIDDVRLIDREAILVRTDLPPGFLRWRNAQSGHFQNVIVVPSVGLEVKRGWCSLDAFVRGRVFRVICTHLEDERSPVLQGLQAAELLAGPVETDLPVIVVGDFNADPLGRNGTTTYGQFATAGLSDAWTVLNPANLAGGLTFGHDPLLSEVALPFAWRIDLALYRGAGFQPVTFTVLDPRLPGSTPPLWPSDHGGIYVRWLIH